MICVLLQDCMMFNKGLTVRHNSNQDFNLDGVYIDKTTRDNGFRTDRIGGSRQRVNTKVGRSS